MSFKIYIVFHKNLFRECYRDIPDQLFREKITCLAVNSQIPKVYDPWFEPSVIKEYELPVHEPSLPAHRFCESSAYIHMYLNWASLVAPYDFVGCFHYDMFIKRETLDYISEILENVANPSNTVFYMHKDYALRQFGSSYIVNGKEECLLHAGWREVLEKYNEFFKTSHSYDVIAFDDMPLNHTFLIHKDLFGKIVPFFISILPFINARLEHRVRHLPYVLESLWGLILLLNKRETGARWVLLDVVHDEGLKDKEFLEERLKG